MAISESRMRLQGLEMSQRVLVAGNGAEAGATPVVMLHGNPDNADEWRGVMSRLASDFRCLAPDLPGYGDSAELPRSFSYRVGDQIRFLDALLEAAEIEEPIILVVHDVGAMMGVPWAAANLDRLHGLIVMNTVAYEGGEWFRWVRVWGARGMLGRLFANLVMTVSGWGGGARFRAVFAKQNPQLSEGEVDRITRTFALNPAAKAATLRQFREATKPEFFDGFDAMNAKIAAAAPVQILWGDGDPYVETKFAHAFATDNVRILPGVGHWPPMVAPDEVANAVRSIAKAR